MRTCTMDLVVSLVVLGCLLGLLAVPASAGDEPPGQLAGVDCPQCLDQAAHTLSQHGLANGDMEIDDFGVIANWAQTNIDLYRWYLVQDVPPPVNDVTDPGNVRWIERVDLSSSGRGFGLKSTDYQNCSYFCSVSAVQIVPAEEDRLYKLAVEGRRLNRTGASIYLDFLNANRGRIAVSSRSGFGTDWTQVTNAARSPAGTRYVRVILYSSNHATGETLWDNAELTDESAPPTAVTLVSMEANASQVTTIPIWLVAVGLVLFMSVILALRQRRGRG